jgi:hypothetical protein
VLALRDAQIGQQVERARDQHRIAELTGAVERLARIGHFFDIGEVAACELRQLVRTE